MQTTRKRPIRRCGRSYQRHRDFSADPNSLIAAKRAASKSSAYTGLVELIGEGGVIELIVLVGYDELLARLLRVRRVNKPAVDG
jgi:hypothetical protein